MKPIMKTSCISTLATLCITTLACGQAFAQNFINLDFEQAVVPSIGGPNDVLYLEWESAVPGWSHAVAKDTRGVFYRGTHAGITPGYLLVDSESPMGGRGPLEGEYSLLFFNGYSGDVVPEPWVHAFIAQTGLVPADALSIRLKADGPLSVFLDDLGIPMVSLGDNDYGGDISAYAGSISELRIQNSRPDPIMFPQWLFIDAIEFSPVAVPEPASGVLLLAGGLLLFCTPQRASTARTE